MKRLLILILCGIFCVGLGETAYANSISYVSRLDLTSGRISGENANYVMDIPIIWQSYLLVDRENVDASKGILEKVNFYYQPQNKSLRPVFLMSLFVVDKRVDNAELKYSRLFQTYRYYYMVDRATQNNFTGSKTDYALFQLFLSKVGDDAYLSDLIQIPPGDTKIYENTLAVNGKRMNMKIIRQNDTAYIPVREACQAMGYRVSWLESAKSISLSKEDNFYVLLSLVNPDVNKGFSVLLKDGHTYVSSSFFVAKLKASVEIDPYFNVSISN